MLIFLKRIGCALFDTRLAFRRYEVAGYNQGYFSAFESFFIGGDSYAIS
jgi:hypothetical protein